MTILDQYIMSTPSHQNAIDLFAEEWSSNIPGNYESGPLPLFSDNRIKSISDLCGGFANKNILELGPLEAAHTKLALDLGASSVTALEANSRSFLKCLITKEILKLNNATFLLGNFDLFLENNNDKYDVTLALGVIYHCINPIKTIVNLCKTSDSIGIWSHYYDEDYVIPIYGNKFSTTPTEKAYDGISYPAYEHKYLDALDISGFCGGGNSSTFWFKKNDWVSLFNELNFSLDIIEDDINHPNGPCITALATKK